LPAGYARDVFGPLVVLGASLSNAFVVLTQEAGAEAEPDEPGPGIRHLRDRHRADGDVHDRE
jgi:hypothetical protein